MYTQYFNLDENPFAITPDPAYLYLSAIHQEALGHLLYGTGEESGFVLLTGEVGTGKTTLVRALLEQDMPEVDVALVLNPRLTVTEFLAAICDELQVRYPKNAGNKQLVDALNTHLLSAHGEGRRTVLIIDEAQNLSREVLEQVRLLTNLETTREKLLRIMLVGQPELQDMLGEKDLRQLSQRITARYHLRSLSLPETRAYIAHRLSVAGGKVSLFAPSAVRAVHKLSRGIPRVVNIICDRALLGTYAQDADRVTPAIVRQAAEEALGNTHGVGIGDRQSRMGFALAATALLIIGIVYLGRPPEHQTGQPTVSHAAEAGEVDVADEPDAGTEIADASPQSPAENEPLLSPEHRLFGAQPSDRVLDRLVALWEVSPPPAGQSPCAWLKQNVSLHCYEGRDDYAAWLRFDRPAILRLRLSDGSLRHVLVTRADEQGVDVSTAAGPMQVERDWLHDHWTGEYLLLWQPPLGLSTIGQQAGAEARQWLNARLEHSGYGSVSAFQAASGLTPDGIAGVRTLLTLQAQTDTPGPRLSDDDAQAGVH